MRTRSRIGAVIVIAALLLPPSASAGPLPATREGRFSSQLSLSGGDAGGFLLRQIRWGDHHAFERIVLEFQPPASSRPSLPRLVVRTEEYPARLVIEAPGSPRRAEGTLPSKDLFRKSRVVEGVDLFEPCADSLFVALVPARPAEYEVFTLANPPRLVVDVRPGPSPAPAGDPRFSLRTLALEAEQACVFLDEARALGLSPRLLMDAAGRPFVEAAAFGTPDEAFRARERLADLAARFSLAVKPIGLLDRPQPLP